MATPHKTSTGAVALAIVLALNLISLPSDACGSKYCCSCPKPSPTPSPRPPSPATPTTSKCPVNTLKLGVCTNVLGWLTNLQELGLGSQKPCCELIGGLADLDAAVCLCTALRANVLGIVDLNLPVQLSLLVNYCDKKLPAGFQCPNN